MTTEFKIEVKEVLIREVFVEADTLEEALAQTRYDYCTEEIVLDEGDLVEQSTKPAFILDEVPELKKALICLWGNPDDSYSLQAGMLSQDEVATIINALTDPDGLRYLCEVYHSETNEDLEEVEGYEWLYSNYNIFKLIKELIEKN